MKKILSIVSSVKGSESVSVRLSEAIIDKLVKEAPGSSVTRRNLAINPFPHMEDTLVAAFYTPEEQHTAQHQQAIQHSDAAIAQLMDADAIVIGVPLYNFGIPSTLKAWIDHVMRAGKTFSYAGGRPEGLVKDKKVYLAIATGAVYSDGPMKAFDFTENYLRAVLGFAGMTDITVIRAEGTSMPDLKDVAIAEAMERVQELVA